MTADFFQGIHGEAYRTRNLLIVPSPADDHAEMLLELAAPERLSDTILDISGKQVRNVGPVMQGTGPVRQRIPTSDLASGLYTILRNGEAPRRGRLAVEH